VAIDFVGPLPEEEGCDHVLSMTDQLGADVRFVACKKYLSARDLANEPTAPSSPPLTDDSPIPPASPPAKFTRTGKEHYIRDIISHKKSGRGWRFLVRWKGFPDSDNEWMTYSALNHTRALKLI
jgi:hypothetical protein